MTMTDQASLALTPTPDAAAGGTLGPPPPRRAMSLRRTASIQAHWPDAMADPCEMVCRGRDFYTGAAGCSPVEVNAEWVVARLQRDTTIIAIEASRGSAEFAALAGRRAGGQLRKGVAEAMPQEPEGSTLLYRLVDDMGGGAFMAAGAWQSWLAGGMSAFETAIGEPLMMGRSVEGVCVSYKPGSPSMTGDKRTNEALSERSVGLIALDPADPLAWHELARFDSANLARIRYLDVWREAGAIHAMFGFQDSAAFAGTGLRRLFHEYRGLAVIDPETLELKAIDVKFGSLPFQTCHVAAQSPQQLVGRKLSDFRQTVVSVLPGTAGCTHLNDSLRTLQDVPGMVENLDRCTSGG